MVERMVQVPVKSIEDELEYRVRTVLARVRTAEKHDEPYPREWVNNQIGAGRERIRALLSQPTPSAEAMLLPGRCPSTSEHVPHVWLRDHGGPEQRDMQCPGIAAPPRIEDMAPGTFLVASVSSTYGLTVKRNAHGTTYLESASGTYFNLPDIDPSTIRDVTPPSTTPEVSA